MTCRPSRAGGPGATSTGATGSTSIPRPRRHGRHAAPASRNGARSGRRLSAPGPRGGPSRRRPLRPPPSRRRLPMSARPPAALPSHRWRIWRARSSSRTCRERSTRIRTGGGGCRKRRAAARARDYGAGSTPSARAGPGSERGGGREPPPAMARCAPPEGARGTSARGRVLSQCPEPACIDPLPPGFPVIPPCPQPRSPPMSRKVGAGQPYPIGATPDSTGTNFAIFSDHADAVTLCLFSDSGSRELERIEMREVTNGIWHCHLAGIGRGQVYGYRVHGPWAPEEGHRFNPNKLLLDPYARQLVGELKWDDAVYGYQIGAEGEADLVMDERDSAPFVPKARIAAPLPLVATRHPRVPWPKSIIYEAHAKGLTMLHPTIPEEIRGTFKALARPEIIDHLTDIGITTLELLPVHAFAQDRHLLEKGLRNYWGYNTMAFFAPEPGYLGEDGVEEIAIAVDRLHQAGIEVILDVVYNHTCEGNH